MLNGSYVLAVIPARGGSKGFPGKNLAKLEGRSLIGRSVDGAKAVPEIDRIIVSTDCEDIAAEARACGADVPFLRPPELATDEATTASVIDHLLRALNLNEGYLVLLQPTSPLRSNDDIAACLALAARHGAAVSVTDIEKPPHWIFRISDDGRLEPYFDGIQRPTRRQDAPPGYALNGAIYVVSIKDYLSTASFVPPNAAAYVMPKERSVDIDHAKDLALAEHYMTVLPKY